MSWSRAESKPEVRSLWSTYMETDPTVLTLEPHWRWPKVSSLWYHLQWDSSKCPDHELHQSWPEVRSCWSVYMETVPTVLTSSRIKADPRSGHVGLFTWRQFQLSLPQVASKLTRGQVMWVCLHEDSSNCPYLKSHQSWPEVRSCGSVYMETVPTVLTSNIHQSWSVVRSLWSVYLETVTTDRTSSCNKAGLRSGHIGPFTWRHFQLSRPQTQNHFRLASFDMDCGINWNHPCVKTANTVMSQLDQGLTTVTQDKTISING
jgi:hypothetical protein